VARIGILGGTFDPPHNGHIAIARAAIDKLDLQKVIIIPAKIQPFKAGISISSVDDRMAMLNLALTGNGQFELSDIEIKRDGMSYTADTLTALRGTYPKDELYLLIGADNVSQIEKWHQADKIRRLCTIAAANRPGYRQSGSFSDKIVFFEMIPVDVSSTEIRRRVRAGESISGMTPQSVESYILNHKLYIANE
jgi:nicotinate-nucleotide adenylyltransferase